MPSRPISNLMGTQTYNAAKYLAKILRKYIGRTSSDIQNSSSSFLIHQNVFTVFPGRVVWWIWASTLSKSILFKKYHKYSRGKARKPDKTWSSQYDERMALHEFATSNIPVKKGSLFEQKIHYWNQKSWKSYWKSEHQQPQKPNSLT